MKDGVELEPNHLLAANTTEKYKVKIKYRDDIELNQLPASNQTLSLSFTVTYRQATSGESNFTSTDKLYLLSTKEVWEDVDGNTSSGIDYYDTTYNNTRQLDYYKNAGVTTSNYSGAIKQNSGSNSIWWLRSAGSGNTSNFYIVFSSGRWNYAIASYTDGVAPAFRIAQKNVKDMSTYKTILREK